MKTVQEYLDETPVWSDGTPMHDVPLTSMQWWILVLAAAGKFFEGMIVFITGVALPLITVEFGLGPMEKGAIAAATLGGILVGATVLGGLADQVGRKTMFCVEMALFCLFLVLTALSPSFPVLMVCLFGLGMALGCDYPTAHLVVSESIPSRVRGRLVLATFGFQSVGALAGTVLGFAVLRVDGSLADWRWMYALVVIPALVVTVGRLFVPESGHWLAAKGRREEAERVLGQLLNREPRYPRQFALHAPTLASHRAEVKVSDLFRKKHRRATILASVPWFLQDLSTYGIGIFTPTILAATLGVTKTHDHNLSGIILEDIQAVKGAALIDVLLLVGIVVAFVLVDRVGRIRLQFWGFLGCAVGLAIAAMSTHFTGLVQTVLIFAGFMLFNFMTNLGPNAMTYVLAGEVFPTRVRGAGAGLAASVGKVGAVLTAFLFPILLKDLGVDVLLGILVGASVLGAVVTHRFAVETNGVSLEKVGCEEAEVSGPVVPTAT
ncbi:MAG: MFS transporter [Candidatus Methylacidiphilales bacterium]